MSIISNIFSGKIPASLVSAAALSVSLVGAPSDADAANKPAICSQKGITCTHPFPGGPMFVFKQKAKGDPDSVKATEKGLKGCTWVTDNGRYSISCP